MHRQHLRQFCLRLQDYSNLECSSLSTHEWLTELAALNTDAVLVTVLETKGSVPREAGTKMVVSNSDIHGTIGGGHLEHQCISMANERLNPNNTHSWVRVIKRFPLGARLGQCCGGVVVVMLEYVKVPDTPETWTKQLDTAITEHQEVVLVTPLDQTEGKCLMSREVAHNTLLPQNIRAHCQTAASELFNSATLQQTLLTDSSGTPSHYLEKYSPSHFHIMLFGAGHVGSALVKTLENIDCHISWVDSRAEQFPTTLPNHTQRIITDYPEDEVSQAPANTCFLIMTHDHQLDQRLCEKVLARDDVRFCGLIGSMTKKKKFEHRLSAKGFSDEKLLELTCPIGVSGITGKEPAVIAVSVAAQLLALQH